MPKRKPHNDELIDCLFTHEDRLTKATVVEIIRRADELLPDLSAIALDRILWTAELPDWWAPIHATYILGAIGTEETMTPLLAALRWADAYDNEWVTEDLPSIFGAIGLPARRALERIVADRSAGWSARAIAMDGLAAIAVRHQDVEDEIVRMIAAILDDVSEELGARRAASTILVDLRRRDCSEALLAFARQEARRFKGDPVLEEAAAPAVIERELGSSQRAEAFYRRNWLTFYEPAAMRERHRRWADEESKYRVRPQLHPVEASRSGVSRQDTRLEDPCPCGSGRSYRRCCWEKLH